MTQPAKSQEPSMEEILASIRRIIADDDATKTAPRAAEPAMAEGTPFAAESELPADIEPPPAVVDAGSNPPRFSISPSPWPRRCRSPVSCPSRCRNSAPSTANPMSISTMLPRRRATPVGEERGRLISGSTSAAVDSAFSTLAQTVLVQNARTLEDLVREMLRPMLKSWLDDNLPGLVERLVRAEIERVSRGRAS
jgi:cell pole-organizing protein PopZ